MPKSKTMTCSKCKKQVKGVSMLKHLWAKHRDVMMKNHTGGKKKPAPETLGRTIRVPPGQHSIPFTQGAFLSPEEIERFAASRWDEDKPTFRFQSKQHPFRIKLQFADGRETQLEVSNICSLELFA